MKALKENKLILKGGRKMSKMKRIAYLFMVVTILAGCIIIPTANVEAASSYLKVGGSTTISPICTGLEASFESDNPDVDVTITEGGSGAGLNGVIDNSLNVGMMSRDLTDDEKNSYPYLIPITIGKDAIAVIVNPSNPITNLTKEQVKDIFSNSATNHITNWNQLGGRDAAIAVHTRVDGSGTLDSFKELALEKTSVVSYATAHASNELLKQAVAADENAIGFISLGYADTSIKTLSINGIEATVDNAKTMVYPYVRPLNLVTKREAVGYALKWIYFCLSPEGQNLIDSKGYIKVNDAQLDIAANSEIAAAATKVKNELSGGSSMPISITSISAAEQNAALAEVVSGAKEAAIIKDNLTAEWTAQGLYAIAVAQDSSKTKFYYVTKGFKGPGYTVEAIGGAELFRYYIRNPKGQLMVESTGLFRIWRFGDVTNDGLVNSADYANLRSYLLKKTVSLPAPAWLFSADVTGDGLINAADYTIMQSYLLKKISVFPAETNYKNYYPPMP
jgi:phosphate transport system substrate-binding protein